MCAHALRKWNRYLTTNKAFIIIIKKNAFLAENYKNILFVILMSKLQSTDIECMCMLTNMSTSVFKFNVKHLTS